MPIADHDNNPDATTLVDRRRPGRLANVSPQLIPLLRAEERAKLPAPDEGLYVTDRHLDTGPGVAFGVGLGALLWAMLIAGGWSIVAA